MTSQINLPGGPDHIADEQRDQYRAYQDHEPYREHVRPSRSPRTPRCAGIASANAGFSILPSGGTRKFAHSERPAVPSSSAGRFVSRAA